MTRVADPGGAFAAESVNHLGHGIVMGQKQIERIDPGRSAFLSYRLYRQCMDSGLTPGEGDVHYWPVKGGIGCRITRIFFITIAEHERQITL